MPESWTRRIAWAATSSTSMSFWVSSWMRSRRASETRTFRTFVRAGSMFPSMSRRFWSISPMPAPANISITGMPWARTSSSIRRSSRRPDRSCSRSFSRVAAPLASAETGSSVPSPTASRMRARGRRSSRSRSSAAWAGPLGDALRHLALDHVDGELGQVADHRLHVPADVAHLGVLGGLDLDERGLGEPGEPPGDLRLPDAGRPDHDDVLGRHLVPELGREVLAPPAVPERDGDRALRPPLPDHVAVELGHDLGRSELPAVEPARHSSSTVTWSFV